MIDPLVSLAFSVEKSKGVYALLLGSGVSRSAGIPTGWEVVLDLVRRLATVEGVDAVADPVGWYEQRYGKEPDYSELLNALCKTSSERQQLLRSYFEPTPDERREGLKEPTKAHRAIAQMVTDEYVHVVLTTNFDRLVERAIEDAGVSPVVISSADAIDGALPLAHQRCCVIKLHGDYLDTRIKNTPAELAEYDPRVDRLLDQVFDEFGLIVCGWSGQWDPALRSAIERTTTRRFSVAWASRGQPAEVARKLIAHRDGSLIDVEDADSFFVKLQQTVRGLADSNRPHPSTVEAAVALSKRYLADPTGRIALADLVHAEAEPARKAVIDVCGYIQKDERDNNVGEWFERFRAVVERLQAVLIQCAAWGEPSVQPMLVAAINRLAIGTEYGQSSVRSWLRLYPAMSLLYGCGLSAIANNRLDTVRALFYESRLYDANKAGPLILDRFWSEIHEPANTLWGEQKMFTPRSEHLFEVMRGPLERFLPADGQYEEAFDSFEYLLALAYMDLVSDEDQSLGPWAPPGRFCWKARRPGSSRLTLAEAELKAEGPQWTPLRAGFFGGSAETASKLQEQLRAFVGRLPYH